MELDSDGLVQSAVRQDSGDLPGAVEAARHRSPRCRRTFLNHPDPEVQRVGGHPRRTTITMPSELWRRKEDSYRHDAEMLAVGVPAEAVTLSRR